MSIAIGRVSAVPAASVHSRPANFGSLVSAIRHGDLEGAQSAFDALGDLAPKAPGPLRKGAFEALKKALAESDLRAADKALKELQQAKASEQPVETPAPVAPGSSSRVDFLV